MGHIVVQLKSFACAAIIAAVGFPTVAFAAPESLSCVQQSRQMCEQERGCKHLNDVAPNQWFFEIDAQAGKGRVRRCSGSTCSSPFAIVVRGSINGEVSAWEPIANEAFALSPDRRQFTHSLTGARGNGGHVVSEFGYCARG